MSNLWCDSVRSAFLRWAHGADAVNFTYGVVSLIAGAVMAAGLFHIVRVRRRGASSNVYGGASVQLILPIYFNILGAFALEYLLQGTVEVAAQFVT
jgi:hypothetical protein